MGVDISALKVKKYLGKEYTEEIEEKYDGARYIFSMNFLPIHHLTKFEEGVYDTEYLDSPDFSMSYSGYNRFREQICLMVHGIMPNEIWGDINEWVGKSFVEFINFADNEGSFDYLIAEKLYKDFSDFKEKAKQAMPDWYNSYCAYMNILKAVSDNKGVIYYS